MEWDGSARWLGWVVLDNLYGVGRPNDPNMLSQPDDPDKLSRLDDRTDCARRSVQTGQARCPNRPCKPKDPNGLGQAGSIIWTSRARRPVRIEQARDPNGPSEFDDPNRLSCVGLKDTSFIKFNLNFFYEKWILDLELDPNIWTEFNSWSEYLDLDLKKKSKLVLLKNEFIVSFLPLYSSRIFCLILLLSWRWWSDNKIRDRDNHI